MKNILLIILTSALSYQLSAQEIDITLPKGARNAAIMLGKSINKIANKEIDKQTRENLIDETVKMFQSEDIKIEVSSLYSNEIHPYSIRQYLHHLMDLRQYEKTELVWDYVDVMSDLKQADDGYFYVVLKIYQRFIGKDANGRELYKDITTKSIEVQINYSSSDSQSQDTKNAKNYKFGNVKVLETYDPKSHKSKIPLIHIDSTKLNKS